MTLICTCTHTHTDPTKHILHTLRPNTARTHTHTHTHTFTHTHTHTHTHTQEGDVISWGRSTVRRGRFQFGFKRWQGWTVSKVLWEWIPNVGSKAGEDTVIDIRHMLQILSTVWTRSDLWYTAHIRLTCKDRTWLPKLQWSKSVASCFTPSHLAWLYQGERQGNWKWLHVMVDTWMQFVSHKMGVLRP